MFRGIAISIALASLAACVTAKTTYLPDGRPGMSINCHGAALSWDQCYRKAGEICGKLGYDVIAKNGDSSSTITGNQYGVYGGTYATRTLLIGCRAAKPAGE